MALAASVGDIARTRAQCRICGNESGNQLHLFREMMFGYRDEFPYVECSRCGCVQIVEIPADMSKYYPSHYYSFRQEHRRRPWPVKALAKRLRGRYAICNRGLVSWAVFTMFPEGFLRLLEKVHVADSTARILDVGCGGGSLLWVLWEAGFKNILGIDPYIKEDITYENGPTILKRTIHEAEGKWDLVMFHHSFEHIADPLETLRRCGDILAPNGCCLLRVPTCSSYAWRTYKSNWVQLDAPRHFFLYSVFSLKILALQAGFSVREVVHDSTEFQFWGSEQYVRDIPLCSDRSYVTNPAASIFSAAKIRRFQRQASRLNAQGDGDQAAFYLRREVPRGHGCRGAAQALTVSRVHPNCEAANAPDPARR